jgi:hypothetical protein
MIGNRMWERKRRTFKVVVPDAEFFPRVLRW